MDLRKLKTIMELFEESEQVSELELNEGDDKIRLRKNSAAAPPVPPAAPLSAAAPAPAAAAPAGTPAASNSTVVAPMVGTFYRAASPETPPFVRIGQTVEIGQTLCIIEAMKLMNEIPSTKAGKVQRILVENGAPVGYGDALFIVE